jgi:hypothetical protein
MNTESTAYQDPEFPDQELAKRMILTGIVGHEKKKRKKVKK